MAIKKYQGINGDKDMEVNNVLQISGGNRTTVKNEGKMAIETYTKK